MFNQTPCGMTISQENINIPNSSYVIAHTMNQVYSANSLIAIGNPMVDITVSIDKDTLQNYGLEYRRTTFCNEKTQKFLDELDKRPIVTYTPGGSVMNTLRVCSYILNMNQNESGKHHITMLGAVGNDIYKDKIINSLKEAKVEPMLEILQEKTSRCGVGIYKRDRCLVPDIQASKNISKEFIDEKLESIYQHDVLLIEGYYLKENYDLCKFLCQEFKKQNKLVILTLSAVCIVQYHMDKIREIADMSDMIIGNMEETEVLAGGKNAVFQDTYEKVHKLLSPKNRLLVVTCGSHGVYCSIYNYQSMRLDLILQCFPNFVKNDDIVDLNGAGDAFLGGFLAMYLKGNINNKLFSCCKAGNNAASVILRNVGCTFPKNFKLNLDDQN
jgi:adenosine kinase